MRYEKLDRALILANGNRRRRMRLQRENEVHIAVDADSTGANCVAPDDKTQNELPVGSV